MRSYPTSPRSHARLKGKRCRSAMLARAGGMARDLPARRVTGTLQATPESPTVHCFSVSPCGEVLKASDVLSNTAQRRRGVVPGSALPPRARIECTQPARLVPAPPSSPRASSLSRATVSSYDGCSRALSAVTTCSPSSPAPSTSSTTSPSRRAPSRIACPPRWIAATAFVSEKATPQPPSEKPMSRAADDDSVSTPFRSCTVRMATEDPSSRALASSSSATSLRRARLSSLRLASWRDTSAASSASMAASCAVASSSSSPPSGSAPPRRPASCSRSPWHDASALSASSMRAASSGRSPRDAAAAALSASLIATYASLGETFPDVAWRSARPSSSSASVSASSPSSSARTSPRRESKSARHSSSCEGVERRGSLAAAHPAASGASSRRAVSTSVAARAARTVVATGQCMRKTRTVARTSWPLPQRCTNSAAPATCRCRDASRARETASMR
mmetsp:Transcript_51332/g.167875  ORF Transcript_51332/g.167875 Transcript_51332/m.167875 type:complete len:450 (+) Transcript_51332:755-2104(+)